MSLLSYFAWAVLETLAFYSLTRNELHLGLETKCDLFEAPVCKTTGP